MEKEVLCLLSEVCGEEILEAPNLDLYEEGLLDSLGLVEFLEGVEDRFNIEIHLTQVSRKDANTPKKLIAIICDSLCRNL